MEQTAATEDRIIIVNKMEVLLPPQELLSSENEILQKYQFRDEKVRLLFVGSQMKRKGGVELIRVLDQLHRKYNNFSAVVIGDLENEYCNFYLSLEEKEQIKRIIAEAEWLDYYNRLSNREVLQYAQKAHVGVLPTMGDTFGFSVLEMQACGCPVITTDRQAMPEINNNQCGWLLNTKGAESVSNDDFAHYTKREVDQLSETIRTQLEAVLTEILEHPERIQDKAICALDRVSREHDPARYASKLLRIYQKGSRAYH